MRTRPPPPDLLDLPNSSPPPSTPLPSDPSHIGYHPLLRHHIPPSPPPCIVPFNPDSPPYPLPLPSPLPIPNSWIEAWLEQQPVAVKPDVRKLWKAKAEELFEKYCGAVLLELTLNFKHVVPLLDFGLIQAITNFLQGLWVVDNIGTKDAEALEIYFVFACVCEGRASSHPPRHLPSPPLHSPPSSCSPAHHLPSPLSTITFPPHDLPLPPFRLSFPPRQFSSPSLPLDLPSPLLHLRLALATRSPRVPHSRRGIRRRNVHHLRS